MFACLCVVHVLSGLYFYSLLSAKKSYQNLEAEIAAETNAAEKAKLEKDMETVKADNNKASNTRDLLLVGSLAVGGIMFGVLAYFSTLDQQRETHQDAVIRGLVDWVNREKMGADYQQDAQELKDIMKKSHGNGSGGHTHYHTH